MKFSLGGIVDWAKAWVSDFIKSRIMAYLAPLVGWFTPLVAWIVGLFSQWFAKVMEQIGYKIVTDAENHIDTIRYERAVEEAKKNPTPENRQVVKDRFDDIMDAGGKP